MAKEKTYYADKRSKCTVHIPLWDAEGKPKVAKDRHGNPKISKSGDEILIMRKVEFQPGVTNPKLGTYSTYKTDNPFDIAFLDKCVEDGTSSVVTEKIFKNSRNPQAYEIELKLIAEQEKREEAEKKLAEVKEAARGEVDKLKAQVEKLSKGK